MSIKNALKYLLSICIVSLNCGHGTCYRLIHGQVELNTINPNMLKVTMERCYNGGYMLPDTLLINEIGIYSTDEIQIDPQSECQNDCSKNNATLPESIRIKVIDVLTMQAIKDTIFKCIDYTFKEGDGIELPVIILSQ